MLDSSVKWSAGASLQQQVRPCPRTLTNNTALGPCCCQKEAVLLCVSPGLPRRVKDRDSLARPCWGHPQQALPSSQERSGRRRWLAAPALPVPSGPAARGCCTLGPACAFIKHCVYPGGGGGQVQQCVLDSIVRPAAATCYEPHHCAHNKLLFQGHKQYCHQRCQ